MREGGELLAVLGRTSGGAGSGVWGRLAQYGLARLSPAPPGSAQVRRLGEDRVSFLPRQAAGALRGPGAPTGKRAVIDRERAAPARPAPPLPSVLRRGGGGRSRRR